MPYIGQAESIIGTFLFLGLVWIVARILTDRRSATLVVQKFHFTVAPQPTEQPSVEVVGRMQGVVAFALSLMGFSPITRFIVAGSELRWQITSLWGQESQYVPLRSVSSLTAGVKKPLAALVVAAAITMTGIFLSIETARWAFIAIALVIAIICVVYYFLSKKFFIAVHPHGGPSIHLVFKPNVIEGVPINVQQAFAVVGVIRDMILSKGGNVATAGASPPTDDVPSLDEGQPAFWSESESEAMQPTTAEEDAEEKANKVYAHAKKLAQSGEQQQAIEVLRDIMRRFPMTEAAHKARRNLERVGVGI